MKRVLSLVLAGALALSVLAGCAQKPKETYEKKDGQTPAADVKPVNLKIGQLPIADGLPFWVADVKGYYKEHNVNVELITFKSANERDIALTSGDIDGVLTDIMSTTTLVASGTKVKITSIGLGVTKEEGPMGILVSPNSGITDLKQLKGVEIAISTNTVMQYVAEKLLADAGFKPDEMKFTNIAQIPLRLESLMSNKIKAAVLPDPLLSLAAAQGAKIVANDKDAKQNYSISVITFSEKAIKEKAEGLKRFYLAYNRGVLDVQAKPQEYMDLLIERAKLPADLKTAYKILPPSLSKAPNKEDVESVVQWLLDKKIISSKLSYEQLVDSSLLAK